MKKKISVYISGIIVLGIVLTTSLYTVFVTGNNCVIDTAVFAAIVLMILRENKKHSIVLSDIFARSSISAVTTIAGYIVAIKILNIEKTHTVMESMLYVISGIMGILFFAKMSHQYLSEERYKFPQQIPRIELLNSIDEKKKNNKFTYAAAGAAIVTFLTKGVRSIQIRLGKSFSIEPSLVTIATGYFIGTKSYLYILAGTFYSLLIYALSGDKTYAQHLQNSYIFSVIVGFSLMQGISSIIEYFSDSQFFKKEKAVNNIKHNKQCIRLLIIYTLILMVFFSGLICKDMKLPFWLFALILPFSSLLSISTVEGIAETGFWISVIDDLMPLVIIILTLTTNIYAIITCVCALSMFEICGIYYIINLRVAKSFSISEKAVTKISVLGIAGGVVIGNMLIKLFESTNVFMTEKMSVPLSQVFAMQIKTIVDSAANRAIPSSINIYVLLLSMVVALILSRHNINVMVILSGMMLPFGTIIMIGIGVIAAIISKAKDKELKKVFSGIALGDGLMSSVLIFIKNFL